MPVWAQTKVFSQPLYADDRGTNARQHSSADAIRSSDEPERAIITNLFWSCMPDALRRGVGRDACHTSSVVVRADHAAAQRSRPNRADDPLRYHANCFAAEMADCKQWLFGQYS